MRTIDRVEFSQAMGLRPLDRLQVLSPVTWRELRNDQHAGRHAEELPYWFFQCACPGGSLRVMTPGGSARIVSVSDVCDIIQGEPIEVRAMPRCKFLAWLSRAPGKFNETPDDSFYSAGYLAHVSKDRRGRLDRAFVYFHDDALNDERTFSTPLHRDDVGRVAALMDRRRMPVLGPGAANYSAHHETPKTLAARQGAVAAFVAAVMRGDREAAATLAACDARGSRSRRREVSHG